MKNLKKMTTYKLDVQIYTLTHEDWISMVSGELIEYRRDY